MGLAYDLNTRPYSQLSDWSNILTRGNFNLNNGGNFDRLEDITVPAAGSADYDEFDILIRKTTYIRDHYIVCGSYRAFFDNLNGGAGAWAWDGFVTIIRAHNLSLKDSSDFLNESIVPPPETSDAYWRSPGFLDGYNVQQPFSFSNQFWTYVGRMPYEVAPDLTGLGADATPGFYSVDSVGQTGSSFLEFVIAGHQRISSAEGALTNMNYSAYIAKLAFSQHIPIVEYAAAVPAGFDTDTQYSFSFERSSSLQMSWKADQANHGGRYLSSSDSYPATFYDTLDLAFSVNQAALGFSSVQLTTLGNGYYLTRIHDIIGLTTAPTPIDLTGLPTLYVTGEVAYDDGAGTVDFTTPMFGVWEYERQDSYTDLYVAVGDRNWGLDSSVAAYDLNGAYGTVMTPSFNISASQDPLSNQFLVGIDRVTHGASTNAEIYAFNFATGLMASSYLGDQQYCLWPFAVKGGPFETLGGFTLPDKWYGRALQQRTFSVPEENTAKRLSAYPPTIQDDPTKSQILESIEDRTLYLKLLTDPTLQGSVPIPFDYVAALNDPNFIDYGQSNKPAFTGLPANIAYGFFGFLSGAGNGPSVFMYDFGTVTMTVDTTVSPPEFYVGPWGTIDPPVGHPLVAGADIIQVGATMNEVLTPPNSVTRIPVSAGWDVDRDQWIFTFADSTGPSVMSCNSAFDRQPPNQVAYLDQTDQFQNLSSAARSASYTPRNMTPYLDGMVLMGSSLLTGAAALGQATMTSIDSLVANTGQTDIRGFQFYTINGSTGRTARVWVDYLLFDGVDSLVAKELQSLGLRVTVENVEWYKAKILRQGELGITPEEIEDWVRSQQTEYRETLKLKERQGRLRTRRRQQAAWREGLEDTLQGDFQTSERSLLGFESAEAIDRAAETFVPKPSNSAPISGQNERKHASSRKSERDNKRKQEDA